MSDKMESVFKPKCPRFLRHEFFYIKNSKIATL
jgi:hypothetical protein